MAQTLTRYAERNRDYFLAPSTILQNIIDATLSYKSIYLDSYNITIYMGGIVSKNLRFLIPQINHSKSPISRAFWFADFNTHF